MENVITIVNTRENPLDFDIVIQGVDSADAQVKFIIETNPVHFGFPCTRGEGDKWNVVLPPLPHIERVSYNFHIEIVVDGYFFEPYRGTINVTAEPEVSASEVNKARPQVTVTGGPGVPVSEPVEEEKAEVTKDSLDALAEKIISKNKDKPKKVVKEPTVEENKKDKLVRDAIAKFAAEPVKLPHKDEEQPEIVEEVEEEEVVEQPTIPRKSNLAGAIKKLEDGPELSDQAKKVRDIIGQ
jgi:hypothetical protein